MFGADVVHPEDFPAPWTVNTLLAELSVSVAEVKARTKVLQSLNAIALQRTVPVQEAAPRRDEGFRATGAGAERSGPHAVSRNIQEQLTCVLEG